MFFLVGSFKDGYFQQIVHTILGSILDGYLYALVIWGIIDGNMY